MRSTCWCRHLGWCHRRLHHRPLLMFRHRELHVQHSCRWSLLSIRCRYPCSRWFTCKFFLYFSRHTKFFTTFTTTLPSLPPVIFSVLKRHFTWIWFSPSTFFDLRLTPHTKHFNYTPSTHYPGKRGKRWVLVAAISRPPATRGGSSAILHYNNHNNNNNNHDINDTNERRVGMRACVLTRES